MKTITLAIVCSLLAILSHAQIQKGSIFIGGSVAYSSSTSSNVINSVVKSSSWGVMPQFGKAIKENKILGVQLRLSGNSQTTNYNTGIPFENNNNAYGLGIFYRQFAPIYKKLFLYGEGGVGFTYYRGDSKSQNIKTNNSSGAGGDANISLGVSYQAGKKLWLEAGIGNLFNVSYSTQKTHTLDAQGQTLSTSKIENFGGGVNFNGLSNLAIGFRFIIPHF